MKKGTVPDQAIVKKEHAECLQTLQNIANVTLVPFPHALDTQTKQEHDFVFVRDLFISGRNGDVIISNFSAKERQVETTYMKQFLVAHGYRAYMLSHHAHAEGGEFSYIPKQRLLFAGVSRNNRTGVAEVANFLRPSGLCIIETEAFHLDTIFTTLLDADNNLVAVMACMQLVKNKNDVLHFFKNHAITYIDLIPQDTIGIKPTAGSMAVNALALPGVIIGSDRFVTPNAEEWIAKYGIRHIVTPVTQFQLSGGSIHCLTNELA